MALYLNAHLIPSNVFSRYVFTSRSERCQFELGVRTNENQSNMRYHKYKWLELGLSVNHKASID